MPVGIWGKWNSINIASPWPSIVAENCLRLQTRWKGGESNANACDIGRSQRIEEDKKWEMDGALWHFKLLHHSSRTWLIYLSTILLHVPHVHGFPWCPELYQSPIWIISMTVPPQSIREGIMKICHPPIDEITPSQSSTASSLLCGCRWEPWF